MARICVVGSCNVDLITYAPRLPRLGETLMVLTASTAPITYDLPRTMRTLRYQNNAVPFSISGHCHAATLPRCGASNLCVGH